jgi:diguanylate cyclase (GGDEF)-like protein
MTQQEQLNAWHNAIDKVIKRAGDEIFTTKEIQRLIGDLCAAEGSPIQGIAATIEQRDVVYVMPNTGICEGTEPPVHGDPLLPEEGFSARVSIRVWPKEGRALATKHWYNKVVDYFRATWLPDVRERQVGLLDLKSAVVRPRLPRSLNRLAKQFPTTPVYAVYIDLDRFKQINTELNHDTGDEALEHVGACIQRIADEAPIFGFRNGGDEFSLLVAGTPLSKLLDLLHKLSNAISDKSFGGQKKLTVGMTAGIAAVSETYTLEDIDDAINQAEVITKDATGDKRQRGTVSIASASSTHAVALPDEVYAKLGTVLSRSRQQNLAPFANVILNIISQKAFSCISRGVSIGTFSQEIDNFIKWLSVNNSLASYEENLFGDECISSTLSNLEVAIAVYHGLVRAIAKSERVWQGSESPRFLLRYDVHGGSSAVFMDDKVLWGTCTNAAVELDLGTPIVTRVDENQTMSATVAFQVGFQTRILSPSGRPLPRYLFSEIVVVDDRPKIGGGLPDFWQAGVANIISAVGANRSFNSLLVVGNSANAPETTSRIRGEVLSNIDELAAITALKREVVEKCLSQLTQPGVVKYENDAAVILDHLYKSSLSLIVWEAEVRSVKIENAPKLKRTIDVGHLGLSALDGLKSETASQAYPAIIEIMRTSEAANMTYDDASQPLREIVGFKLVLDTPTRYPVPDYWSEQEAAFREYAEHVLLSEKGIISSYFHEDGQYEAFIQQLVGYCSTESIDKSTRRAILIVKNVVENGELRPLGLVSIWAAPRHSGGTCSIEFSFVWRTVEALVGLPYSLYGSIMLVEQIVDAVKSRIHSQQKTSPRIGAGRLTYLALSLHMRVDEFHKRIAKRIADAASV